MVVFGRILSWAVLCSFWDFLGERFGFLGGLEKFRVMGRGKFWVGWEVIGGEREGGLGGLGGNGWGGHGWVS